MSTRAQRIAAPIGGLSEPSKMPCHGYSLPASACQRGSALAKVPGSVCASCYALKGRYAFASVQQALERRLAALHASEAMFPKDPAGSYWALTLGAAIRATGDRHFRWHDSGDVQSLWHLSAIAAVCRATPDVAHWLPTREERLVRLWLAAGNTLPANLTLRLSATHVDAPAERRLAVPAGCQTSGVVSDPTHATCPASVARTSCGACRACWDRSVPHVAYLKH